MPELPEVTTTVNGLQRILPGLAIVDVWTDLSKNNPIKQFIGTVKDAKFFKKFKKEIVNSKILNVERRAKNILINISGNNTILIHLKMTGHIIYGKYVYNKKNNTWAPDINEREALHDPYNRFVHVVFTLSNGKQFVLCDTRKFGKVTMLPTDVIHTSVHLHGIGPEPLENEFSFDKFKDRLLFTKSSQNKNIKTVLMDQSLIAGIGNIYSDEMLWSSGIHPESKPITVPNKELKLLFKSMKDVLMKGIDFGGDSMSDYRDIDGKRGDFQNHHNVYRRLKEKCIKKGCIGTIKRKVIADRSAHFCDVHQKLF